MKEKYVWEIQLRNLGGPNYGVGTGVLMVDDQGREVPGQRGYKYYGRARELPGTIPRQLPKPRFRGEPLPNDCFRWAILLLNSSSLRLPVPSFISLLQFTSYFNYD